MFVAEKFALEDNPYEIIFFLVSFFLIFRTFSSSIHRKSIPKKGIFFAYLIKDSLIWFKSL